MQIGELVTKFTADMTDLKGGVAQYGRELDEAEKETEGFDISLKSLAITIGAITAAITAGAIVIIGAITKYGQMAQNLKDVSFQTGLTTDQLQKMQYAAVLSGISFDRVSFSLTQLSVAMANSSDKTSQAYKTFTGLGIDTQGKSVQVVFDETARALMGMTNEADRNRASMDLFGRGWRDIIPFMQTYIDKTTEIQKHPVISEQDLKDLQDGKIAIDKLSQAADIYLSKLVLIGERGLNPSGGKMMTSPGMTEIKGSGADSVKIMAERYGPLTPLPPGLPPGFSPVDTKAGEDLLKKLGQETDDYKDKVTDLYDEKKKLYDLDKNYGREMSVVGWDVGRARELTIRHGWAEQDQMGKVGAAATAAGVAGKKAADTAGITVMGNFSINVNGMNKSLQQIYDEGQELAKKRIVAGIHS